MKLLIFIFCIISIKEILSTEKIIKLDNKNNDTCCSGECYFIIPISSIKKIGTLYPIIDCSNELKINRGNIAYKTYEEDITKQKILSKEGYITLPFRVNIYKRKYEINGIPFKSNTKYIILKYLSNIIDKNLNGNINYHIKYALNVNRMESKSIGELKISSDLIQSYYFDMNIEKIGNIIINIRTKNPLEKISYLKSRYSLSEDEMIKSNDYSELKNNMYHKGDEYVYTCELVNKDSSIKNVLLKIDVIENDDEYKLSVSKVINDINKATKTNIDDNDEKNNHTIILYTLISILSIIFIIFFIILYFYCKNKSHERYSNIYYDKFVPHKKNTQELSEQD